jgi:hypothetical protein
VELWIVREVPAWLVGVILIVGLPALILALDVVVRRKLPHKRLVSHNDVTGVIVSVVGVAYAIVVGLCVVSLWEGYTDVGDGLREEAVALTPLVPASAVFGTETQVRITEEIVRYEEALIADWHVRHENTYSPERTADLTSLTVAVSALSPTTEAQKQFVHQAYASIGRAEQLRQKTGTEIGEQRMSDVMWIGILVSTAAILLMSLFFGLDDGGLRRILLIVSTAVIATNLFLIVEMNYPYYGSFSVTPESYERVIGDLRRNVEIPTR